jgi:hypothetical protein
MAGLAWIGILVRVASVVSRFHSRPNEVTAMLRQLKTYP